MTDALARDLRHAARTLRANPGLVVVATLSLALGIGANVTVFSWARAVLLEPLSGVPGQDRLGSFAACGANNHTVAHNSISRVADGISSAFSLRSRALVLHPQPGRQQPGGHQQVPDLGPRRVPAQHLRPLAGSTTRRRARPAHVHLPQQPLDLGHWRADLVDVRDHRLAHRPRLRRLRLG